MDLWLLMSLSSFASIEVRLGDVEVAGGLFAINEHKFKSVMALENSVLVHMKSGWASV